MKKELTKIQEQTFKFIENFYNKKGICPILKDIQNKFEISSGAAGDRIKTLIRKGWLIKKDHKIKVK